nr:immunoglobulin heavy chain junction region [Macaca mulatta]MOW25325.1 immunoglobulin heavy chain junction region [Macaca mulatta]
CAAVTGIAVAGPSFDYW